MKRLMEKKDDITSNLDCVFELKNLRLAYRWIMSNPDASYKSYFRNSYSAFAFVSDSHLRWIGREVLGERYQPTHASKIMVPKPSGVLRPITLLGVEDQIVYQACVNYVAEALRRKTKKKVRNTRIRPFIRWQAISVFLL